MFHNWQQENVLHRCDSLLFNCPVYGGLASEECLFLRNIFALIACSRMVPIVGDNFRGYVEVKMHGLYGTGIHPRSLWAWGGRARLLWGLMPQTLHFHLSMDESWLKTLLWVIQQYWVVSASESPQRLIWHCLMSLPRQREILWDKRRVCNVGQLV